MKNLHVIPTDKPSRLYLHSNGELQLRLELSRKDNYLGNNQNIYITNSEEIKEGDYGLSKLNEIIKFRSGYDYRYYKKIILTTDQDLIKDGVQAIDDEFLEWFVKNPSCEEIEVESNYRVKSGTIQEHKEGKAGYEYYDYKIIIPKEEPKQETLEEAAELYYLETKHRAPSCKKHFIEGAKWQAERSQQIVPFDAYNIEVFAIKPDEQGKLFAYIGYNITNGNFHFNVVPFTEPKQEKEKYSEEDMTNYALYILHNNVITPKEWFEQFKNKGYEQ